MHLCENYLCGCQMKQPKTIYEQGCVTYSSKSEKFTSPSSISLFSANIISCRSYFMSGGILPSVIAQRLQLAVIYLLESLSKKETLYPRAHSFLGLYRYNGSQLGKTLVGHLGLQNSVKPPLTLLHLNFCLCLFLLHPLPFCRAPSQKYSVINSLHALLHLRLCSLGNAICDTSLEPLF